MTHRLHTGHNAEVLKQYPDSHFDAIVTDPPYGIEFLGKDWDQHTGTVETWRECLRVLKPGGHLLAHSAPHAPIIIWPPILNP
jgi:DNA modification methylase